MPWAGLCALRTGPKSLASQASNELAGAKAIGERSCLVGVGCCANTRVSRTWLGVSHVFAVFVKNNENQLGQRVDSLSQELCHPPLHFQQLACHLQ